MALKPTTRRTEQNRRESRRAYDRHRGTTTERGYGWDWQCYVRDVLKHEKPICERCWNGEGRVVPAEQYHHRIKIKDDPSKRFDLDNIEGLCEPCHQREHATR